jgi:hypothetical protein
MTEQERIGYKIVGTIKKIKGACYAGHKAGDQMEVSGYNPMKHQQFPVIIDLP